MTATTSRADTIRAVDPATGETLGEVLCVTPEQVTDALRRARAAQQSWGERPVGERVRALRPLLDLLIERRDLIARAISRETGKPRFEALLTEVLPVLDGLDFLLRKSEDLLKVEEVKHRLLVTTRSSIYYEPYGVVGVITPWNYPFLLTTSVALSALFAGNAVLNKPSEYTPLVGQEIEKLLRDAGLAPALYQCLPGRGDIGAKLVQAGCDKICFTGSAATGRKVAAACGERLIPVSLELGGKDPAIVLEDADVERAVASLTWGAFTNCGQACASTERIYVHDSIYDSVADKLIKAGRELRQGPDAAHDVDVGVMVNRMQYDKVEEQVADARARGARVLLGGEGQRGEGEKSRYYFPPTILADCAPDLKVMTEETFGPVVTLHRIHSEEEAIRLANDSPYGLTASVWTRDKQRATRLAHQLHFGSVFVNDALVPSGAAEVPWGGVKDSGFGRARGPQGLREMCRVKVVSHERLGLRDLPVWYPYGRDKYQALSEFIPALFSVSPVKRVQAGWRGLKAVMGWGKPG